jgi:hypothetical protein
MIVFGKNYSYANAKSTGDSYRFAAKNLLATSRHSSTSMLDDALYNVAWQSSLLADKQAKSKSGYVGTLVDIFA